MSVILARRRLSLPLRAQTADATPTALTTDGAAPNAANQYVVANYTAATMRLLVAGRGVGLQEAASWEFAGGMRRHGSAALGALGSSPAPNTGQAPLWSGGTVAGAWTCAVSYDSANGGLKVEVVGTAAVAVRWSGLLFFVEANG